MSFVLKANTSWNQTYARCVSAAPEAFDSDRLRNLVGGEWVRTGVPGDHRNPVDGLEIEGPPQVTHDEAVLAVQLAVRQHAEWAKVGIDERKARIARAVAAMREQRELLALLLVWEIGKPWRLACADVDRALDGVDWYLGEAERQLAGRTQLPGPVSNIASWNYPMSVQIHAELVQLLAGNAVIAKTPTQGGFHCLTLAHALMAREGLPVTLLSGRGASLGDVLIRGEGIGALAFVGGRANGRKAATTLADTGRRHFLEQEGLNTWGIWNFSQWDLLAGHIKKGFEYGKQRCTAYPRFVVQRHMFAEFLQAYLPVVESLRYGNPLAVESADDPYPELDFGPVISAAKATELRLNFDEAINGGGIPLVHRSIRDGRFLPQQDKSAYVAPACVLQPPSSWSLHHSEPFGPLDSIVVVDTEAEFLAAMNASNGALVGSIATDDSEFAHRVADDLQSFKVGINMPRSRGDRDEVFGGKGASWKGAFVGGDLLVQAVTQPADGSEDRLYGNFPSYSLYPDKAIVGTARA
ncbi:MAG: aldehyde dehydrogenase family protein [Actinomycetota bacterium]|nr:aldehyde dehydrogenase family protein [Actinomycetota bacterium]